MRLQKSIPNRGEMRMNLERIKEFVKAKHIGQTRKQGTPYYLHPFAVQEILAQKGYSEEYQVAGLCHDLLEDTNATEQEILEPTNPDVLDAVKRVTKEKGYLMGEYIARIAENPIAKAVKLADRLHNLQEAVLASKEFQIRYEKETKQWYLDLAKGTCLEEEIQKAYTRLKEGIEKR